MAVVAAREGGAPGRILVGQGAVEITVAVAADVGAGGLVAVAADAERLAAVDVVGRGADGRVVGDGVAVTLDAAQVPADLAVGVVDMGTVAAAGHRGA